MSSLPPSVWWAFLSAGLALCVILLAFAAALVINQRRFVTLHRNHAERLLRAQEEERAWVAREVHDDALQRIAMLVHELDAWGGGAAVRSQLGALRTELEDLSVVLRRLAYRLHPSHIEQEGIVPAVRRLAADLCRSSGVQLEITEDVATPCDLTGERTLVAYRIAQEALSNLVRHAGVGTGAVRIRADDGVFALEVADEGRGFTVEDPQAARGLGLISMAERARAAGGSLTVLSEPGAGTVVRLRLPYRNGA